MVQLSPNNNNYTYEMRLPRNTVRDVAEIVCLLSLIVSNNFWGKLVQKAGGCQQSDHQQWRFSCNHAKWERQCSAEMKRMIFVGSKLTACFEEEKIPILANAICLWHYFQWSSKIVSNSGAVAALSVIETNTWKLFELLLPAFLGNNFATAFVFCQTTFVWTSWKLLASLLPRLWEEQV